MWSLVWTVWAASLVGSLHCAGMCGGFVAFAAGADRTHSPWRVAAHYHVGRLLAYATLGAAAGTVGKTINLAGSSAGLGALAASAAGALMVGWGLALLLGHLGVRVPRLQPPAWAARAYGRVFGWLRGREATTRAGVLGLASALLPCGWLYAFVVTAAGTGSAAGGAVAMAAFWAGTLPVLVALGAGVRKLAGPLRVHLPRLAAVAMMLVGGLTLAQRTALLLPSAQSKGHACCHEP